MHSLGHNYKLIISIDSVHRIGQAVVLLIDFDF